MSIAFQSTEVELQKLRERDGDAQEHALLQVTKFRPTWLSQVRFLSKRLRPNRFHQFIFAATCLLWRTNTGGSETSSPSARPARRLGVGFLFPDQHERDRTHRVPWASRLHSQASEASSATAEKAHLSTAQSLSRNSGCPPESGKPHLFLPVTSLREFIRSFRHFARTSQAPSGQAALVFTTTAIPASGDGTADEDHHRNGVFANPAGSKFEKHMVPEMPGRAGHDCCGSAALCSRLRVLGNKKRLSRRLACFQTVEHLVPAAVEVVNWTKYRSFYRDWSSGTKGQSRGAHHVVFMAKWQPGRDHSAHGRSLSWRTSTLIFF